jgi:hypothetical protein
MHDILPSGHCAVRCAVFLCVFFYFILSLRRNNNICRFWLECWYKSNENISSCLQCCQILFDGRSIWWWKCEGWWRTEMKASTRVFKEDSQNRMLLGLVYSSILLLIMWMYGKLFISSALIVHLPSYSCKLSHFSSASANCYCLEFFTNLNLPITSLNFYFVVLLISYAWCFLWLLRPTLILALLLVDTCFSSFPGEKVLTVVILSLKWSETQSVLP